MGLLQGFLLASRLTQGYKSNKFQVAHRLRDFYGIYKEVILLFNWIGYPVFSQSRSERLNQRKKEVQRLHEQTWCLGIGWCLLLISEKSCKLQ